jgi:hypothetical protein
MVETSLQRRLNQKLKPHLRKLIYDFEWRRSPLYCELSFTIITDATCVRKMTVYAIHGVGVKRSHLCPYLEACPVSIEGEMHGN